MAKKIISRPIVKTTYLDNRNGDKVTYLEIPEDINRTTLMNDIGGSGKHFEPILKYIDKENPSRMVLISAENQEMGLITVSYIAGSLGDNYVLSEFYEDDYIENEMYEDQWIECKGKIPIIHASDVACFYSSLFTSVDFGRTLRVGQSDNRDKVPYWTQCHKEAVCILLDDSMGKQEIDILTRFSTNKRVYVVYADKSSNDLVESDEIELPFGLTESERNAQKNRAVLYHCMDEIQVCISKENKWKYYTDVAKQAFRDHDIVNTSIIPYDRIVAVAEGVAASNICTVINKIVEYSIKDYQGGALRIRRLGKADFDFLTQFEKRESLGEKTASDRLNNDIIGLPNVKEQVKQVIDVMKLNKLRADMGLEGESFHNVHVMLGAPGTAKTTVAKLMGEIMSEEGLLPGKRAIVINGAQLKGEYVGQSAPKTHALFESYDIIIIDEAYSMVDSHGGTDSYSNEAIAQLIIELEKHSTDKLVIFAGYGGKDIRLEDNKMQLFLNANPGIQSRVASTIYFPSYTPDEMVEVFLGIAKRNQYNVEKDACRYVKAYFAQRVHVNDFGNGREARNLLDTCTRYLAERIIDRDRTRLSKEDVMTITPDDVRRAVNYLGESYAIRNYKKEARIGFR